MAVKKIYADLDVYGIGIFTGVVSGADGLAAGDFITKGQLEALNFITSLQDDVSPVLSGSLDAGGFSIVNLNAITGTGNILTTGTVIGSNIIGVNTGDQDLSGFLPLTAGAGKSLTGAIFGGANLEIATKARHTVIWGNLLRNQYNHWNGSSWVATAGIGIGEDALLNNSGYHSNGIGYNALNANTGDYANGIGYNALLSNTGIYSNGIGHSALANNTGGESNGLGYYALYENSGFRSTGVGHQSLNSNSGAGSTGIGSNTLFYNDGNYNTAIGSETFADNHIGQGINNTTVIGANAEPTAANQIMLGDAGITRVTVGNVNYFPIEANDLVNKSYVDGTSIDLSNYKKKTPVTYLDSIYTGGTYIDKGTEEVFLAAANDIVGGGFHGIQWVEKHNCLYAVTRGASTLVYRFSDPSDLTVYTTADISVANYPGGSENIVYDSVMDKLYVVMSDSDYTQYDIVVREIDPVTLAFSTVITYTSSLLVARTPFIALNGFLYVAPDYYNSILYKFDLSDYSMAGSVTIGSSTNGIHSLLTDGDKIYATGIYPWGTGVQVCRIEPGAMFLEERVQVPLTGADAFGGFTDDGIVIGDYIYLLTEGQAAGNSMYKIAKNDLTDHTSLKILIQPGAELWALAYENNTLWYVGSERTLGSLNINTHENILYESPFTNNVNELVFNDRQFLVAGFDVYPVLNTGFIGRTGAPFKPLQYITLAGDGLPVEVATALDELTDVIITTPATTEVLTYDGINWVNSAPVAGGTSEHETLTAVGGETELVLSNLIGLLYKYQIFRNGQLLAETVDYTLSHAAATTITFITGTPLVAGEFIDVYYNEIGAPGNIDTVNIAFKNAINTFIESQTISPGGLTVTGATDDRLNGGITIKGDADRGDGHYLTLFSGNDVESVNIGASSDDGLFLNVVGGGGLFIVGAGAHAYESIGSSNSLRAETFVELRGKTKVYVSDKTANAETFSIDIPTGITNQVSGFTVATLPAGTQGDRTFVTDAITPTYLGTLTGGGTVVCPVFHNGTAWVSH